MKSLKNRLLNFAFYFETKLQCKYISFVYIRQKYVSTSIRKEFVLVNNVWCQCPRHQTVWKIINSQIFTEPVSDLRGRVTYLRYLLFSRLLVLPSRAAMICIMSIMSKKYISQANIITVANLQDTRRKGQIL